MDRKWLLVIGVLVVIAINGLAGAEEKSDALPATVNPYSFNLHGTWVKMGSSQETIKASYPDAKTSDTCGPMVDFDDEVPGVPASTANLAVRLSERDCANFRFTANRLTYVELISQSTEGAGPVVGSFEEELMKVHGKGKVTDETPPYINTEWSVNGTRIIRYDYFSESGDSFTNFRLFSK